MFDRFYVARQNEISEQRIYINEQRAPTDKSVELMKEMEKAVEDKILQSMALPSNRFGGTVQVVKYAVEDRLDVVVNFELNGIKMKVVTSSKWDDTMDTLIARVVQDVADTLSRTILSELFKGLNFNRDLIL